MLRVELSTQLFRLRTLIALAGLAAVPAMAAASFASQAGHRNGTQGGLFGASPYSALNHAMASLEFAGPLLLPIVVALLAAAIASADRDWGVLRYLYVAPVSRARLLTAKLTATALAAGIAVACTVGAGLIAGAAVAFTLGLVLPRGAEAVAAAIGFVVVGSILNGQSALHPVAVMLPVHYWQDWTGLFAPGVTTHLGTGLLVQAAWMAVCTGLCLIVLRRRDPAA